MTGRWSRALVVASMLGGACGAAAQEAPDPRVEPVSLALEVSPVSSDDPWAFLDSAIDGLFRLALRAYPEIEVSEPVAATSPGLSIRDEGGAPEARNGAGYRVAARYVTLESSIQLTIGVEAANGEHVAGLGPVRATPETLWNALERLAWELQATLLRRLSAAVGRRVAVTCLKPRPSTPKLSALAREIPYDALERLQPTRQILPLPWEQSRRYCSTAEDADDGEDLAADLLVSGVVEKRRRRLVVQPYIVIRATGQTLDLSRIESDAGNPSALHRSLAAEVRGALAALVNDDGALEAEPFERRSRGVEVYAQWSRERLGDQPYLAGLWASRAAELAVLRHDKVNTSLLWSQALSAQGRYQEALAVLPSDASGAAASVLEQRGRIHLLLQEADEAVRYFREALKLEPDDASCRWSLGIALQLSGDQEAALAELHGALAGVGDDPGLEARTRRAIADIHGLRAEWVEALEVLQPMISEPAVAREAANVLLRQTRALMDEGSFAEAEAKVRRAYELRTDPGSLMWLTRVLLEQAKFEEVVVVTADAALEAPAPGQPEAVSAVWNNRGFALHRLQRFEESRSAYLKAREYADSVATTTNLAILYLETDDELMALREARELVERRPADPRALNLLADVAVICEDFTSALAAAERLTALDPEAAPVQWTRGAALLWLRRFDEAVSVLRRAAALDPTESGVWINLSVALAETGDLEGAWKAIESAVELRPDSATAYGQLANLAYTAGDEERGAQDLTRALELDAGNPWTNFVAARHHAAEGRTKEAMAFLRRAMETRGRYWLWIDQDPAFEDLRSSMAIDSLRLEKKPESTIEPDLRRR